MMGMSIEVILTIIGLVIAVITLGRDVVKSRKNKSQKRPRLEIQVQADGGGESRHIDISRQNDASKPIEVPDLINIYELTWKLKIIIQNNSDTVAYHPQIWFYQAPESLEIINPLNQNQIIHNSNRVPLKASISNSNEFLLKARFTRREECKAADRTHPDNKNTLAEVAKMQILLEYQDDTHAKFYTLYTQSSQQNQHLKKKPKIL